jgi:hypothetical protein
MFIQRFSGTQVRIQANGKPEYWCRFCGAWTLGSLWVGTGYTEVICPDCGATLVSDYYVHQIYENQRKDGG